MTAHSRLCDAQSSFWQPLLQYATWLHRAQRSSLWAGPGLVKQQPQRRSKRWGKSTAALAAVCITTAPAGSGRAAMTQRPRPGRRSTAQPCSARCRSVPSVHSLSSLPGVCSVALSRIGTTCSAESSAVLVRAPSNSAAAAAASAAAVSAAAESSCSFCSRIFSASAWVLAASCCALTSSSFAAQSSTLACCASVASATARTSSCFVSTSSLLAAARAKMWASSPSSAASSASAAARAWLEADARCLWARSSSSIRPTELSALVSAGAVAPVAVAVRRGGFIGGDALREKSATASVQHAQRPAQPARSSGYRSQGNL
eukprot:COSAG05_NODE_1377_length_5040_cov_5.227503_1_plen_317_part_00